MAKYVAIGDIHGRYDLLEKLLENIEKTHPDARLAFLGDMVDRGPDSFKVVDTIKKLTETKDAIAIVGNHEDMMMEYFRGKMVDKQDIWMYNGGIKTVDSYGKEMGLYGNAKFFEAFSKSGHAAWMKELPLNFETDEVWFSHAPIPEDRFRPAQFRLRPYRMCSFANTWSFHGEAGVDEDEFARDHGKVAVCGHVHAVMERIFVPRAYKAVQKKDHLDVDSGVIDKGYHKIIYADTGSGCWKSAPLTGVVITDGRMSGFLQAYPEGMETAHAPGWSPEEMARLRDWGQDA